MVAFKNVVTGNILYVSDKSIIAMMERSSRYEKVASKKAPEKA